MGVDHVHSIWNRCLYISLGPVTWGRSFYMGLGPVTWI